MRDVAQGSWEAEELVAEALEVPALYRGLSTEYTDVGRLLEYLADRLFSGVVRVTLPGREAHLVLFRGRAQAARYAVEGQPLDGAEAVRSVVADARWMEGEVWVHELPEELFPEDWDEREPLVWEAVGEVQPEPAQPAAGLAGEGIPAEPPAPAAPVPPAQPPPEPAAPDPAEVVPWVRLLEGLVARFRRYRGPTAAGRLEAEVNAALVGTGLQLQRGRVEGEVKDLEWLHLATVRAVGFVKGMAGQAFAEQSLRVAAREAGFQDLARIQSLLGT